MRIEERLREAYERTRSSGPAETGAYDRFLRRRARSVRTVTAALILLLALAGLTPRLLAGQDRGVVHPPRPVPAVRTLIARLTEDGTSRPRGVSSVAFGPDGNTLAVSYEHRITLWDVDRRSVVAHLDGVQGVDQVTALAFAPDGRTLAASAYDRVVLWDLASRTRLASLPMGTANLAGRLEFSPNGTVLAAGDGGGKLILWDVARRSRLAILPTGIGGINDLAFRADGQSVAVGGRGPGVNPRADGVAIIDVARRRHLWALRTAANSGSGIAVAFRPDGTVLAAVGRGGQELAPVGGIKKGLTIWDVTRKARLGTLANEQQVGGVVLSRDGGLLAVSSPAGTVVLWDVGRHVRLGAMRDFHPGQQELNLSPQTGTFTDDGRKLAVTDGTGSVFVWSTANP
jgi:WD40 repeat protein